MARLIGKLSGKSNLSGSLTQKQTMEGQLRDGVYIEIADSVQTYDSHFNFPNLGKINTIYISESENRTYRWDEENLRYYCVGSNYDEIEIIDGGVASGK